MRATLRFARGSCLAPLLWVTLTSTSIATLAAADKNEMKVDKAATFANHQSQGGIVLAAEAYTTDSQAKQAFGKVNPYDYGALPIMLVIDNDSQETLDLRDMHLEYQDSRRRTIDPVPAAEVKFLRPPDQPKPRVTTIPGLGSRTKKNPLDIPELEGRAFVAKMMPAGDTAHGFIYFNTEHRAGATLVISGMKLAPSGKELFFVEIPLGEGK